MLVAALPLAAHHSFAAQYDASKLVTFHGEVARVAWTNPHAMLVLNVRDESGKRAQWEFELGSPNGLEGQGFTRNTLKPGDEIVVRAYPAKDGTNFGNAYSIDRANGTPVLKGGEGRYSSTR